MFLISLILVSFHPACVHFSIAMSVSRFCVERPLLSCRCWSSDLLLISTVFYITENAFNISWAHRGYFLEKNEVQIVKNRREKLHCRFFQEVPLTFLHKRNENGLFPAWQCHSYVMQSIDQSDLCGKLI
jgi:hypothetical protein